MDSYEVGKIILELKTGIDMVQIHYREPFWELAIAYPGITETEINELTTGNFRMAITTIDECLFFLFSVGRIPWSDAPYEPRISKEPMNYSINFPKGRGVPLVLLMVDSNTGCLKGMRVMGLGNLVSTRIHTICRTLENQRPLDKVKYHATVEQIYKRYPHSEDMLKTVKPGDVLAII